MHTNTTYSKLYPTYLLNNLRFYNDTNQLVYRNKIHHINFTKDLEAEIDVATDLCLEIGLDLEAPIKLLALGTSRQSEISTTWQIPTFTNFIYVTHGDVSWSWQLDKIMKYERKITLSFNKKLSSTVSKETAKKILKNSVDFLRWVHLDYVVYGYGETTTNYYGETITNRPPKFLTDLSEIPFQYATINELNNSVTET